VITGHLGVAGLLRWTQGEKFGKGAFVALAVASLFPDVLDGVFFLTGFCSPYGLYSHNIYSVLLQAAVLGGAAFLIFDSRQVGVLFASAVLLHLAADLLTGQKLLVPGGEMIGLYLYDRPVWDFVLEVPLLFLGWLAARRSFRVRTWLTSTWLLALFLAVQALFDTTMHSPRTRKPTACFRSMTPEF
jgi:hypothetical protein